jgi:hypothetical protein
MKKWEDEVSIYLETINKKLQENNNSKELYYGFEVIDGKLIENPEILFIGINPGFGNEERHYQVKLNSERISYLDYFDDYYNYALARETVKLFELAGFNEEEIIYKLENKCVKTNLYHIITRQSNEIKKCINNSELSYDDYYRESTKFCISLIKTLKPKIVILEGKEVFDTIIVDCYEKNDNWDKELNFGYYFSETENIHFIGYKRKFSNILHKKNVSQKLKQIIKII